MTNLRMDDTEVEAVVRSALLEDGALRDITTMATVPADQMGRGHIRAKQSGVVAGLRVAQAAFSAVDRTVVFEAKLKDGDGFGVGDTLAQLSGPLASIISAERVALNFLQRLSGVATSARAMVDRVQGLEVRIVDTRKTTPGLRALERQAVLAGGGHNHRFNLSDGVLIKDNHLAAARVRGLSLADVVRLARAAVPHTARLEIEVTSIPEAEEAVAAGADVVLLDNMPPAEMARAVTAIAGRALTEASGGVTLENIRQIAETGVDIISSGALTHSAPAIDISLDVEVTDG